MTRTVLLNNVEHKDLRVVTRRGAQYGDQVMCAVTFPAEFRNIAAHYPIVFQKSQDGLSFQALALFGFHDKQNLFLRGERWDAHYVPLAIERQPFLIGFDKGEAMVHIDLDSPRVSPTEGEPVFLPFGGNTEFLDRVSDTLQAIHQGLRAAPAFISALMAHDLLEPVSLDVQLPVGGQFRWSGFYIVHEERLQKLGGPALGEMNQAGHLLPTFMAVASVSRFRDLIERIPSPDA